MKAYAVFLSAVLASPAAYSAEVAPTQKAEQKSAVRHAEAAQKAFQKSDESPARLGWFARRAARRSCSSGSCR